MGTQQMLLILLTIVLVGIAVAVGVTTFDAQAQSSNKMAIKVDLEQLRADAMAFKQLEGNGVYTGYPDKAVFSANANATYGITAGASSVTFVATSARNNSQTITVALDATGTFGAFEYEGW